MLGAAVLPYASTLGSGNLPENICRKYSFIISTIKITQCEYMPRLSQIDVYGMIGWKHLYLGSVHPENEPH